MNVYNNKNNNVEIFIESAQKLPNVIFNTSSISLLHHHRSSHKAGIPWSKIKNMNTFPLPPELHFFIRLQFATKKIIPLQHS